MAKDYQLLGKIKKTLNKYIFVVLREPPRQSEAVVYGHSEGLWVSTLVYSVYFLRHPHCHIDMSKKVYTVYSKINAILQRKSTKTPLGRQNSD